MSHGRSSDRGQAFPIYIVVVAGLLFAGLAFFVVGMAGVRRSDAQGAADAAALAAARHTRDSALVNRDLLALQPADWEEILKGNGLDATGACAKAVEFASLNAATARCDSVVPPEFTVTVTTDAAVGDSVIRGTESRQSKATATAVIEPRCSLGSAPEPAPSSTSAPGEGAEKPVSVSLRCKGGDPLTVDPSKPGSLLGLARTLFTVRLAN
ncbi:pilus assembly protein TadG-related protein [Streptomyces sp. NPDC046161]|uniref:pilus assembly protein TadG-related protein n=1 Tax=Streptomyces sp. NPDC046161 TaxID=3155132 RepID=UPI0033E8DD60